MKLYISTFPNITNLQALIIIEIVRHLCGIQWSVAAYKFFIANHSPLDKTIKWWSQCARTMKHQPEDYEVLPSVERQGSEVRIEFERWGVKLHAKLNVLTDSAEVGIERWCDDPFWMTLERAIHDKDLDAAWSCVRIFHSYWTSPETRRRVVGAIVGFEVEQR